MTSLPYLSERNGAIYERRKQGLTLQAVGNEFGLSVDRVSRICLDEAQRIERAQQTGKAPLLPVRGRDWRAPLTATCQAETCERKPRKRVNGLCLCGLHEQRLIRTGSLVLVKRVKKPWTMCTQPMCKKRARSRGAALCDMHYHRWYRKQTFEDPVYGRAWATSHGYIVIPGCEHPLTPSNGHLYKHRAVLYDAIGPGKHACHWCKREVEWLAKGTRTLVVDHLDGMKSDNALSNLVPSCRPCNANRGLFMEWVMKHKDDPFLHDLFDLAKRKAA